MVTSQSASFLYDFFASNLPVIVLLWLIGVLLLTMRLLGEFVYLQHLKKTSKRLKHSLWMTSFHQLAAKMELKKLPGLMQSRRVGSPMVIGFLKPLIIIPVGLVNQLSPREVESILAHELAHVSRLDYLVNVLQSFIETLLFFNPAVWWLSSMIRTEREYCCDDVAINITGDEVGLAKTLARLEEWRYNSVRLSLGFANHKKGVLGRIQRIAKGEPTRKLPFKMFWSFLIIGLVVCSMAIRVSSQEQSNPVPEPAEEPASPPEAEAPEEPVTPPTPPQAEPPMPVETPEPENEFPEVPSEVVEPEVALAPNFISKGVSPDSLPDEEEKLRMEMEKMRIDMERKKMEIQKEKKILQKQKLMMEQEMKRKENEQRPALLELERKERQLRLEQEEARNQFRMKKTNTKVAMLELEKQIRELELEAVKAGEEEGLNKEVQEKIDAHWKKVEDQKRLLQEEEIMMEKQLLELEQQMQQLENQAITLESQREIEANKLELKGLELEEQIRELEFKYEMLGSEFQIKHAELYMKLQELKQLTEKKKKKRAPPISLTREEPR
jgi:beta-lactamase regulating signal transducer with metallopeptidase domain